MSGIVNNINRGYTALTQQYVEGMIGIAVFDESLDEINYIKSPMTGPNGEKYLVAIIHVEGPKIDLNKLREN